MDLTLKNGKLDSYISPLNPTSICAGSLIWTYSSSYPLRIICTRVGQAQYCLSSGCCSNRNNFPGSSFSFLLLLPAICFRGGIYSLCPHHSLSLSEADLSPASSVLGHMNIHYKSFWVFNTSQDGASLTFYPSLLNKPFYLRHTRKFAVHWLELSSSPLVTDSGGHISNWHTLK